MDGQMTDVGHFVVVTTYRCGAPDGLKLMMLYYLQDAWKRRVGSDGGCWHESG